MFPHFFGREFGRVDVGHLAELGLFGEDATLLFL
jgi:hypothetical protein